MDGLALQQRTQPGGVVRMDGVIDEIVPLLVRVNAVLTQQRAVIAVQQERTADIDHRHLLFERQTADRHIVKLMIAVDTMDVAEPAQNVVGIQALGNPVKVADRLDGGQRKQNRPPAFLANFFKYIDIALLKFFQRRFRKVHAVRVGRNFCPVKIAVIAAEFQNHAVIAAKFLRVPADQLLTFGDGASEFGLVGDRDAGCTAKQIGKAVLQGLIFPAGCVKHNTLADGISENTDRRHAPTSFVIYY